MKRSSDGSSFVEKRVRFVILVFLGLFAPLVALIFVGPMVSANEVIRGWSALDCLTLSGSIAAGRWAFAARMQQTAWYSGAPLIAGLCSHVIKPSVPTKLLAGVCAAVWIIVGLSLTFVDV